MVFDIDKQTAVVKTAVLNGGKSVHSIKTGSKVILKWGSQNLTAEVICMSGKKV